MTRDLRASSRAIASKASTLFTLLSTKGTAAILTLAAVVVFAYCAGRSSGVASERGHVADSVEKVLRDSAKVQHARTATDSAARVAAEHRAAAADASRDSALAAFHRRVRMVSAPGAPLEVSVDGGPPSRELPAELAVPAIETCETAAPLDTALVHQLRAEVADLRTELATAHQATATAEAKAKAAHPRFGFKSGVVAGAAAVIAIVRLLK